MEPPAVVVGPGTEQAVPYAVGADVTWLGENGAPVFRWTAPVGGAGDHLGRGPLRLERRGAARDRRGQRC